MPGSGRMVLVVDQFERLLPDDPEIDRLLELAGRNVRVVLAVRAEAYGQLLAHPGLAAAIEPLHAAADDRPRVAARDRGAGAAQRVRVRARAGGADRERRRSDLRPLGAALHALWERDAGSGTLSTLRRPPDGGAARTAGAAARGRRGGAGGTRRSPRRCSSRSCSCCSRVVAATTKPHRARSPPPRCRCSRPGSTPGCCSAWRRGGRRTRPRPATPRSRRCSGPIASARCCATAPAARSPRWRAAATCWRSPTAPRSRCSTAGSRLPERLVSPDGTEPTAVAVSARGDRVAAAFGGDVLLYDAEAARSRLDGARDRARLQPRRHAARRRRPAPAAGVGRRRAGELHEQTLSRERAGTAADVRFDAQGARWPRSAAAG